MQHTQVKFFRDRGMAYLIDAWLEEGIPHLRISDAQTGTVRLQWTGENGSQSESHDADCDHLTRKALQRLFRDLVLLSCAGKLTPATHWQSSSISNACLHCDACIPGQDETHINYLARD